MDDRIELLAETGMKVVTPTFGLGPINDPNRPFQARRHHRVVHGWIGRVQPEATGLGLVEIRLMAIGYRWDALVCAQMDRPTRRRRSRCRRRW